MDLAEVLALVKAGPYDVLDSWEKDEHFYFKLGLKVDSHLVPFVFAIPMDRLTSQDEAVSAVNEQLQIVSQEHGAYLLRGVPPNGMPLWS